MLNVCLLLVLVILTLLSSTSHLFNGDVVTVRVMHMDIMSAYLLLFILQRMDCSCPIPHLRLRCPIYLPVYVNSQYRIMVVLVVPIRIQMLTSMLTLLVRVHHHHHVNVITISILFQMGILTIWLLMLWLLSEFAVNTISMRCIL